MKDLKAINILPYIPHRPPMLLVSHLLSASKECIEAEYTITEDCIFLREDKSLERCAYTEILAQSFAVGVGYIRNKKEPDIGFLATMRGVKILLPLHLGDRVHAKVSLVAELDGIIVVDGELSCNEQKVCEGQFKVYIPDEQE